MKSAVIVPLFATVALAATSSLIPAGISTGCSNYLNKLNSNTTLSACTTAINAAVKPFQPGASSASVTKASVTTALQSLCAAPIDNACQVSTMRGILTDFYTACSAELTTSSNADVMKMYDTVYLLAPLRNALCTKSDAGAYCAATSSAVTNGTTASSAASASATPATAQLPNGASLANTQQYLAESDNGYTAPNATTFASSNVAFLFFQSSLDNANLCTSCTKNIFQQYITFETSTQYAPGIANSQLFPGQTALYNAITSKCGNSFLQTVTQGAGSLGAGLMGKSSGAEKVIAQFGLGATAIGALFMAVAAF